MNTSLFVPNRFQANRYFRKETMMRRLNLLFALAPWTLLVGTAGAAQCPKQGQPKPEMEEKAIQALRNDPQMRQAFINRVAAPIVRVQHDSLRIELFASRSSNENHFTA